MVKAHSDGPRKMHSLAWAIVYVYIKCSQIEKHPSTAFSEANYAGLNDSLSTSFQNLVDIYRERVPYSTGPLQLSHLPAGLITNASSAFSTLIVGSRFGLSSSRWIGLILAII